MPKLQALYSADTWACLSVPSDYSTDIKIDPTSCYYEEKTRKRIKASKSQTEQNACHSFHSVFENSTPMWSNVILLWRKNNEKRKKISKSQTEIMSQFSECLWGEANIKFDLMSSYHGEKTEQRKNAKFPRAHWYYRACLSFPST